MKRTAVLLDLGFLAHKLYRLLDGRHATANEIHGFATACIDTPKEELFRIYCYDCPPYDGVETHPLTGETVDFGKTGVYLGRSKLIRELKIKDNVAFRSGALSFDGWTIRKRYVRNLAREGRDMKPEDVQPDLKQKRVDMKIGLDVAWLSSKAIVERIVLVTADSDFIPAMKFARREGVQVILVTLGHQQVNQEMKVHADELRSVDYP
jgi:uncharacterized LabA/DUF88 family protein